jgi:hypothetical protein
MKNEILEPIEIEVDKYTEEDYDQMLDECYGEVKMGSFTWNPSYVLKNLDLVAYRCGFSDYCETETKYKCPICDTEHNDEDDAKWCCQ